MHENRVGIVEGHGGTLALAAIRPFGGEVMFTLNGGHVWPLYDAARQLGVRIVDTRHEQSATWAAEAYAKLTRRAGLAVLTAGPGVTNGVSAITSACFNGSPLVVLGGRAPQARWGAGSLQELDHIPIVASVTKAAQTITSTGDIGSVLRGLAVEALTPHRGPVFADIPMDVLFAPGKTEVEEAPALQGVEPDGDAVDQAAARIAAAERPALIVGSDVYWAGACTSLAAAVDHLRLPTFANGMGRGCLADGHPLGFSRTRGRLKSDADLVVVIGTPLDFRLGFGRFGSAPVIHITDSEEGRAHHVPDLFSISGDLGRILERMASWSGRRNDHEEWIASLRAGEDAAAAEERSLLDADTDPIKPTRVFGELRPRLVDDAVIICDGGDFASYAGKYLEPRAPGCWLDTGPYGCLGNGPGYAIGARVARPASQVVVILGDGAAGFSLMDVDTMVRHGLPAVIVVGNNGIWGLEKHPMQAIYGWDEACDLQPQTRYDQVATALGAGGELVTKPGEIGPALDRAFASGLPYVVNVITDPADSYPRSSNLA